MKAYVLTDITDILNNHRKINSFDSYSKDKNHFKCFVYDLNFSGFNFELFSEFLYDKTKFDFLSLIKTEENYKLVALNPLYELSYSYGANLEEIVEVINNIKIEFNNNSTLPNQKIPLFVGGTKFNSYPNSSTWNDFKDNNWFIPALMILQIDNKTYLILNESGSINPDMIKLLQEFATYNAADDIISILPVKSEFEKNNWYALVNSAISDIQNKKFEKIVLARKTDYHLQGNLPLAGIYKKSTEKYPHCYNFIFRKNTSLFFGASPEKLLSINGNTLETDALAGSYSRGLNENEDQEFEKILLNSKKDLYEHKTVADYIINILKPFANDILSETCPEIKKFENIQHLWTPIKANLKNKINIIDLVNRIHPTPAVCGVPANVVLPEIMKKENFERGMFAGLIGWFNPDNQGDFAVAIRSALLKNNNLTLYAGCGIVDGSDAAEEYLETGLKLNAILSILQQI